MAVLNFSCSLVPCVPGIPEDVSTAGSRTDSSLSLLGSTDCAHVVTPDLGDAIVYLV